MRPPPSRALPVAIVAAGGGALLALACAGEAPRATPEAPAADRQGTTAQAIVNGTTDATHAAVVSLLLEHSGASGACSGTIVRVKDGVGTVITSAHCFRASTAKVTVRIGPDVLAPSAEAIVATGWELYPAPPGGELFERYHDLALVFFPASGSTSAIPMAKASDYAAFQPGASFVAVGYGVDRETDAAAAADIRYRRKITLTLDELRETALRTRSAVGSICSGDSGGALLDSSSGTERLVGVNGSVSACSPGATNESIGFFEPPITKWLRDHGFDAPDGPLPLNVRCDADPSCASGACAPFKTSSDPEAETVHLCDEPRPNSTNCETRAHCISRFCPASSFCRPCAGTGDCEGRACDDGVCAPPPGAGEGSSGAAASVAPPGPEAAGARLPGGDGGAGAAAEGEVSGCAMRPAAAGAGARALALVALAGLARRRRRRTERR